MSLLVDTLDNLLDGLESAGIGDWYLMQDIVRYLHEYSDTVHHPTEDLMFEKLVQRNPDRKEDVARLRREHVMLEKNTSQLVRVLETGTKRRTEEDAKKVRDGARGYIRRLRKHMQFEQDELFPSATRCLTSKDWHDIELSLEIAEDPLFGDRVQREYRVLYEYFADRAGQLSRSMTNIGFLQLDNMIVSADAIEAGVSELLDMLQEHGIALEKEYKTLTGKTAERGLLDSIGLQAEYVGLFGKTVLEAGGGAVGIYFRTLKNAAVSLIRGAQ
jgi:hemerythrin-like domain-containing protein